MQHQFPKLFVWWKAHQDRTELTFAAPVEQQAEDFIDWLEGILAQQVATCPFCGRDDCKRASYGPHRPQFVCFTCEKNFNLLSGTSLSYLQHPHIWVDFVKLLVQGYSDSDIKKSMGIGQSLSNTWRHRFIRQMQTLGYDELVQWLTWQRRRRYNQVSQETRQASDSRLQDSLESSENSREQVAHADK